MSRSLNPRSNLSKLLSWKWNVKTLHNPSSWTRTFFSFAEAGFIERHRSATKIGQVFSLLGIVIDLVSVYRDDRSPPHFAFPSATFAALTASAGDWTDPRCSTA